MLGTILGSLFRFNLAGNHAGGKMALPLAETPQVNIMTYFVTCGQIRMLPGTGNGYRGILFPRVETPQYLGA